MATSIATHIELQAIRRFLDTNMHVTDCENEKISKREEAEEFEEADDDDNAMFWPMQTEEIAIRTVFNEVRSLIEWSLRTAVPRPIAPNKQPSDPFRERLDSVIRRVERRVGVPLAELQGWTTLEEIREANNAFKHRKGFLDIMKHPDKPIPTKLKLQRKDAYAAIAAAKAFLTNLEIKLRR